MWCYSVLVLVGVAVGWSVQVSCYVVCPDGSLCANDNTCCKNIFGGYGCCPFPQAVCCSDMMQCCPNGWDCHVSTQTCTKEGHPLLRLPMRQKVIAGGPGGSLSTLPLSRLQGQRADLGQGGAEGPGGRQVDCGEEDDGSCPSGTECCRGADGGWLCCPVSAQDLGEALSPRGSAVHPATKAWNRILGLRENEMEGSDGMGGVYCDAVSYCPSGTSCCQGTAHGWSCCPDHMG
ncbi:progranulin isoform X1 [Gadus morhua]|uniref:progranulin isoform X1 n=1 Tax=Gadus morhua TaxID=8049 RepID=UPI0011B8165F|nr:progranulin-like isoform X1 [Gadus morhua]